MTGIEHAILTITNVQRMMKEGTLIRGSLSSDKEHDSIERWNDLFFSILETLDHLNGKEV